MNKFLVLAAIAGAVSGCSTFDQEVAYRMEYVRTDLRLGHDFTVVQAPQAKVDAIAARGQPTNYRADAVAEPALHQITFSDRVRVTSYLLGHEICHLEVDPTDQTKLKAHDADGVWNHTKTKDRC